MSSCRLPISAKYCSGWFFGTLLRLQNNPTALIASRLRVNFERYRCKKVFLSDFSLRLQLDWCVELGQCQMPSKFVAVTLGSKP
jgi:hypothetical protein